MTDLAPSYDERPAGTQCIVEVVQNQNGKLRVIRWIDWA